MTLGVLDEKHPKLNRKGRRRERKKKKEREQKGNKVDRLKSPECNFLRKLAAFHPVSVQGQLRLG